MVTSIEGYSSKYLSIAAPDLSYEELCQKTVNEYVGGDYSILKASENVQKAIHTLIKNIDSANVPLSLISQFMPIQYTKIRNGELKLSAEALIKDRIVNCIDEYMFASEQDKIKF